MDSQPLLRFIPIFPLLFWIPRDTNLHFTAIPRFNALFGHYPIVVPHCPEEQFLAGRAEAFAILSKSGFRALRTFSIASTSS